MKVLLAVDGSADTKKMLAYLTTHETLLGSGVGFVLLNVQIPVPAGAANFVGRDSVDQFHLLNAEEVLSPVCKFLERHKWTFVKKYVVGSPGVEIVKAAKAEKADMIVMGSEGRSSLGALILGSVVQKVLALSDIPVLVVR
jgi:nucleotide-binding universal stress UspA family protein